MFLNDAPQAWLEGRTDDHPDVASPHARPVGRGTRVVRQGECAYSIAHALGVPHDKLWDHPGNDALRSAGREPSALLPGDRLTLPTVVPGQVRVRTGARHAFRARVGLVDVSLTLRENGAPLADVRWQLEGEGVTCDGTTDGEGVLSTRVPTRLRRAQLRLRVGEASEVTHDLVFGALDPIGSTSGVQARLANLGFDPGPVDGALGPKTRAALRSFQSVHGLRVHGGIDQQTLDRLREQHGG
jgi:N-acetylmuramoyl-L-alanine amidase